MSAVSVVLPIAFVAKQLVTYVGIFFFVMGIIGGPLVLLVFLSLRTFRQSSCAFYLTIMSVVNTIHMFTGLLTFIMTSGFGVNWTNMSIVYCKLRAFYIQLCILMSFTCMCLAVIDQFLATCSNPRWHRWNNIKAARCMITGATILTVLEVIPSLIYFNHIVSPLSRETTCTNTNAIYQRYLAAFYNPVLISALPLLIMSIFGVLAYQNVQQIAYRAVPLVRRELDKQLTKMVLVQVLADVLALLPNFILLCYSSIKNLPSGSEAAVELGLINNILIVLYFWHFVGPFYIYVCASKRFRQQLIHVLFTVHLNRWYRRGINNNQIAPEI